MRSEPLPAPGEESVPEAGAVYAYKPSLMGTPWEFRLTPTALEWRNGPREGRIPYAKIRRVRLSFRPATMQGYRFLTQVWADSAPRLDIYSTSWRGMLELARQDGGYRSFVAALHRYLAAAGGTRTEFMCGVSALRYWPAVAVFGGAVVAFAALILRALSEAEWAAAAFIAVFLSLLLWQVGGYVLRNRPGVYRPPDIPPHLLPR
jgi:hypothetical protein